MPMYRQIVLLLCLFCSFPVFSQDVWLQNHFSPNSGCVLSNSEVVNVLINNNSGVVMASNTINVSYTIDGGSLTQQLLSANLFAGASWSFSFAVPANLSACGDHVVKVWVSRAGDANQLNDTLIWNVRNDCLIVPGSVQTSATVCEAGNSGTLNLMGWSNGTIVEWQYSVNGGASWTGTGLNTASYAYSGLSQSTDYRVVIDGGYCVDDTSATGTITVQPVVLPGTISGGDSLCITAASGMLNLTGATGTPLQWEYSIDAGGTWTTDANTTTTENYTGLVQTTWYRAYVEGGFCPDVYSDTAVIYVEQLTDPATISGSDSLCATMVFGTLTASGNIGSVSYWESSTDNGASWSTISNQTTTLNYSGMTQTTWYRLYTDGGFCPDYYSDTAVIYVQPVPVQPTVNGSDSLCSSNANGVLTLSGVSSSVIQWESSTDNGANWTVIANPTTTENYNGLLQTTWYRALIDGELCADIYSDTAVIYVEMVTGAGTVLGSDSLCIDAASGMLNVTGSIGSVMYWEFSVNNGANWSPIANTTTTENYSGLTQTTWYRVYTQGEVCPGFFSDTAIIFVDAQLVVPGNIIGGDTVCDQLVAGVLTLNGFTGSVTQWESSTDGGANWTIIANTTNTLNCPLVTQTTWYRAYVDGVVCSGGYSDTAYIVVDALTNSGILNQNEQLCAGDSAELSVTGYTASTIQWESSSDGANWSTVGGATADTYTAINVTSDQFFRVIVQNGACPSDTTNAIQLTVVPLPAVDAGADATVLLGDSIQLSGSGGVVGVWMPGSTLSDSLISAPLAFPSATTSYTYTVMDGNGCMNSDVVIITVVSPTDFDIKNVITANDDGYNDTWFIEGLQYYPLTFVTVFNVYGEEVYSSNDYQNDWDATFKGRRLPNGTYYYTVIPGGTETKLKGTLTILGDE